MPLKLSCLNGCATISHLHWVMKFLELTINMCDPYKQTRQVMLHIKITELEIVSTCLVLPETARPESAGNADDTQGTVGKQFLAVE